MKESIIFRWVVFFVGFALMFAVFDYLLNFETVVAIIAAFAVSLLSFNFGGKREANSN